MTVIYNSLFSNILSFIFPHSCVFCRKMMDYRDKTYICKDCYGSLPYISAPYCEKCGKPSGEYALSVCRDCRKFSHAFSGAFTPLIYKNEVRRAIMGMKFYSAPYVSRAFAFLIAECIISRNAPHFDFVTFVPLSPKRFNERGYNQSYLIAKYISEILDAPLVDALSRADGFARQSTLSPSERRKNAKAAFSKKSGISLSGTALLVDDVYTTGSTMDACSRLLLSMGCERVYIASAAIVG